MKPRSYAPAIATSPIFPLATAALAVAIFVIDTVTNLEIAVAVLYVAVVLMSVGFCQKRGVILVSLACVALTVLSFFLTESGPSAAGLINCGISLLAIAATTLLVLRIESAELTAQQAKAQLAHIARVTALGELTASIAHEVNQPLTATVINAKASLHFLAAQPPTLEEARQAIECIAKDATRASDVVVRVRGLAKRSPPQKELLNINETVNEIIKLTSSEIHNNHVWLHTQLADHLPFVLGDRVQLQQVILNLILNAIEAMNGVADDSRELLVKTAADNSNAVLVVIHDTGPGLEPDKIDDLFDAFYTTKRDGMGMGLAISRSIIEAHGGRVWAEPNTPQGAIFQFTLPVGRGAVS
jgi:C4-dicarboxylate-specific signal transduction histidine kinase